MAERHPAISCLRAVVWGRVFALRAARRSFARFNSQAIAKSALAGSIRPRALIQGLRGAFGIGATTGIEAHTASRTARVRLLIARPHSERRENENCA